MDRAGPIVPYTPMVVIKHGEEVKKLKVRSTIMAMAGMRVHIPDSMNAILTIGIVAQEVRIWALLYDPLWMDT